MSSSDPYAVSDHFLTYCNPYYFKGSGDECPVCMSKIIEGIDKCIKSYWVFGCDHALCDECVSKLKKYECPMCRKVINRINSRHLNVDLD